MATAFPLPTECLHLVIRHLADAEANKPDSSTLASLLRVSKYVHSATLPIMYEDPFRFVQLQLGGDSQNTEILPRLLKLIRLLFLSLPEGQAIADILRAAYLQGPTDQDNTFAPVPPFFPYYELVTDINFRRHSVREGGLFYNAALTGRPSFVEYLNQHGKTIRYLLEEISVNIQDKDQQVVIYEAAARELRSELIWALCEANAGRIKELVIPIMDISRYISLVPRLKVLSEVTFLMDKGLKFQTRFGRRYTPDEQEALELLESRRILALEEMITFTQKHCRLFPNMLMIARCHKDSGASNDNCPHEYQFRLLQSLPPLIRPTALNNQNWIQFAAKPQGTDLSLVKSINPRSFLSRIGKPRPVAVGIPFLHRCRALERITMPFLDDDTFQWAVDERKQYNTDIAAGRVPQHSPVPLRKVNIDYHQPAFGRQINDVVFAFGRTLKDIRALGGWWRELTDVEKKLGFSIGEDDLCWDVPQLSNLTISMNSILIRTHPDTISRCCRLTRLFMRDHLEEYRLDEVNRWTPAELPELIDLYLEGTPAICFDPRTLKSTLSLESMEMSMNTARSASPFIPPVEEFESAVDSSGGGGESDGELDDSFPSSESYFAALDVLSIPRKRPSWTWDWDLPKLVSLKLNGEFGYRFQFRMLSGAPNILYFTVDVGSWSRQHYRTVEIADFLKPGYRHPQLAHFLEKEKQRHKVQGVVDRYAGSIDTELEDDQVWKEFEYVQVAAIKRFILTGPWSLDGRVLEVLFGKVAPSIKDLTMSSRGHSVASWVESSKYLYQLENAHLCIADSVSNEMLSEVGLGPNNTNFSNYQYRFLEPPVGRTLPTPALYSFRNYL
ncbi:hypothetical protein BGZ95_003410 [Linnemannia exigua]|uniref:Uncharacterized protein n=1 Tax=Linnemannia exigua TaxID=604196 RepID=A0AAD4DJN8_9FUNG|nr:hypothetical protein BGZ95_003410 [Linnemannia exigua]